jgi:hypothetical protein
MFIVKFKIHTINDHNEGMTKDQRNFTSKRSGTIADCGSVEPKRRYIKYSKIRVQIKSPVERALDHSGIFIRL